ncbi:hypothetical protein BDF19DRAFT_15523 [Syncephalis fuscata]|nr:hypothetical protein BDF19DRAFT_15523 [Syncephalis fuscata]
MALLSSQHRFGIVISMKWPLLLSLLLLLVLNWPDAASVDAKKAHWHTTKAAPNATTTTNKHLAYRADTSLVLKMSSQLSAQHPTEIAWTIGDMGETGSMDRFLFEIALGHADLGILQVLGRVHGRLVGNLLNTCGTAVASTNDAFFRFNVTLDDTLIGWLINLPDIQLVAVPKPTQRWNKQSVDPADKFTRQLITNNKLYITVWGRKAYEPPWSTVLYYNKHTIDRIVNIENIHVNA